MIIRLLLQKFAFPQLLQLLKSAPFKSNFLQLREFSKALVTKTKETERLFVIFDKFSIYEIMTAFTVFDIQFIQILISTQDIHSLMQSLMSINELPSSIHSFVHSFYFRKVGNRSFWLKIYSRKQSPKDGSYNWGKLFSRRRFLRAKRTLK